ncbi:MAG TPA: glycosyltransferase family 4 protein [Pedobacter sp.]|jgi:glycosyltransferase involved in cell wall biosynthesis
MQQKSKIAFIVQRYGLEVNGGAEQHCRLMAEKLTSFYDVDVLTSCALTYLTWDNHYSEGRSILNDVNILRFPTATSRQINKTTYNFIRRRKIWQKALKKTPILNWLEEKIPSLKPQKSDFEQWVYQQGPATPELITYLEINQAKYKALIFFTYLYYPTINGLEIAPSKSILIPTAHDENAIYIPFFERLFRLPKTIIYNTIWEKKFVNQLFKNDHIDAAIGGVGVEIPLNLPYINIKKEYQISKNYLIYIGRVEAGKGCKKLIDYFKRYNKKNNSIQLVLIGQLFMSLPQHPDIIPLGFVSEEVKFNALSQAEILVMPSQYESLSMVTLEAMKLQKPVIVNEHCAVLKQHVNSSKGGFSYRGYKDFENAVDKLLTDKVLSRKMGIAGKNYVDENYEWNNIVSLFKSKIERL